MFAQAGEVLGAEELNAAGSRLMGTYVKDQFHYVICLCADDALGALGTHGIKRHKLCSSIDGLEAKYPRK